MQYKLYPGKLEINTGKQFAGQTVLQFLEYFHQSKKNRYLMVLNKQILLNKEPVKNDSEVIQANDKITILLPDGEIDFKPASSPCQVVYEDDFVYVVHKEAGVIVHGSENDTDALANQAAAWLIENNIQQPVRYIHRLDRDTSGLVLFVKIPFFQPYFDYMLENKQIHRHYMAITEGKGREGAHFTYRQKIGKDRHVSGKYRFSETGKEAVTKVEFIEKKEQYLLVGCTLETGRTHQIRVHLSGNRHPIVNDPLYGVPTLDFAGMGLWADEITFTNPVTEEVITVKDTVNPDFKFFHHFQ